MNHPPPYARLATVRVPIEQLTGLLRPLIRPVGSFIVSAYYADDTRSFNLVLNHPTLPECAPGCQLYTVELATPPALADLYP